MTDQFTPEQLGVMKPQEFRQLVRKGDFAREPADACTNYGQANLIALPKEYAFDFLLFCKQNPRK